MRKYRFSVFKQNYLLDIYRSLFDYMVFHFRNQFTNIHIALQVQIEKFKVFRSTKTFVVWYPNEKLVFLPRTDLPNSSQSVAKYMTTE